MGILYHYTDVVGMLGILEKNKIQATNILYMNDSDEYSFARNIFIRVMDEIKNEVQVPEGMEYVIRNPLSPEEEYRYVQPPQVYAFCLSEKSDDSGQWNRYGQDGMGYVIGFDQEKLEKLFGYINKVSYLDTEAEEKARKLKLEYIEAIKAVSQTWQSVHPDSRSDLDIWMNVEKLCQQAQIQIATCKNSTWSSELEQRIILNDLPPGPHLKPMFYPKRNGLIAPYVLLEPPVTEGVPEVKLPILEIIIGRRLDFGRAKMSLEFALQRNGFDKNTVAIKQSRFTGQ